MRRVVVGARNGEQVPVVQTKAPASLCEACEHAKPTEKSFPSESTSPCATEYGGRIHSDVWGPVPVQSTAKRSYMLTFMDERRAQSNRPRFPIPEWRSGVPEQKTSILRACLHDHHRPPHVPMGRSPSVYGLDEEPNAHTHLHEQDRRRVKGRRTMAAVGEGDEQR